MSKQPVYTLYFGGEVLVVDEVTLGDTTKVRIETGPLSSNDPYVLMSALHLPLGVRGTLHTRTPRSHLVEHDLGSVVEAWNYTDFPSTAIVLIFDTKAVP